MDVESRLMELNLTLPEPAKPAFNYVPVTVWQDVAYVSGQLPKVDNGVLYSGKVPAEVSADEAKECARVCVLQALACLKQELGDLNRISRILRVTGFVNSSPAFRATTDNRCCFGTSPEIFQEEGRHARSAIGVAELPRRSPVEIEFIVAVKPSGPLMAERVRILDRGDRKEIRLSGTGSGDNPGRNPPCGSRRSA